MSRDDDPTEPMLLKGARFNVHRMTLTGDDGRLYQREVIRHPGAVVLLPILEDGRVVLIENTRPTVGETLLELPAGTRESGEEAVVTASRELIEETGYRAGKLELIHEFYSAPGICDELMHLYRATELVAGDPDREATESIVNRIATRDEIKAWIASGKIRDAKTLVGLYAWLSAD
ncbi:NUDIX hydrolase [Planctomycetes bacterium TBK1r]|uniref:GDP-mannose pyrophosphatase n=1 Tax=Stieleria magnilauensis TaxID=2527963 RepID=A0ABX5XQQ3_9BACT|nr:ADP-ribose pyrophosphatase [Planctomycetes bacterium TBK1r]